MRSSHVLAALALAAALAAVAAIAIPAGAQSPTTLTSKELNKGSTFKIVDVPPKVRNERTPPGPGDILVITAPLTKTATNTAGNLHADCLVTKGSKKLGAITALCDGAYAFKNGTLFASTLTKLSGHTEGAIVGGTGDYARAEGTFESKDSKGGSITTITLIP